MVQTFRNGFICPVVTQPTRGRNWDAEDERQKEPGWTPAELTAGALLLTSGMLLLNCAAVQAADVEPLKVSGPKSHFQVTPAAEPAPTDPVSNT